MNNGKKTALIVAICLIAAGLVLGGLALATNQFRPEGLMKRSTSLKEVTHSVSEPFTALDIRAIGETCASCLRPTGSAGWSARKMRNRPTGWRCAAAPSMWSGR